jgi:hypothetical protein
MASNSHERRYNPKLTVECHTGFTPVPDMEKQLASLAMNPDGQRWQNESPEDRQNHKSSAACHTSFITVHQMM